MPNLRFFSERMARTAWLAGCLLLSAAWSAPAGAQTPASDPFAALVAPANEVRTPQTTARLIAWAPQGVAAGKPLWVGLQLRHAPGWHSYWQNPGDAGAPTVLHWRLPTGLVAGDVVWPVPSKIAVGPLANYGYEGTVLLAAPVTVQAAPAGPLEVALQANWLVCKKECLPEQGSFRLSLPPQGQPLAEDAAVFEATLATAPQPLPTARLRAAVSPQAFTVRLVAEGLPANWRGKALHLYPQTPGIITPAAAGTQGWQGSVWHMELPLHPQRGSQPAMLPVVLALQDTAATSEALARNAPGTPAYRLEAAVQGDWPAHQAATQTSPSPALDKALSENMQAQSGLQDKNAPTNPSSGQFAWWLALGAAFVGGLVLNLMPCVFPVLAVKVMGFARHAHRPRDLRISGLAYSAGVVGSMVLLAAALLLVRAGGEQLGWGFQLQNPYVVAALAALFTALALNLAGLYDVGHVLPGAWMQASARHPVADALLSGVLAVLVASPCSAPLLGASLGFALGLPAAQALLVFACMGLGLALPVLAASFAPRLLGFLPRPGPWMVVLRRGMAFPMFAAVIWLVWVLGRQSGMGAVAVLLALLLGLAGLLWALQLAGRARWVASALFLAALLGVGAGYGQHLSAPGASTDTPYTAEGPWQPWSPQRVQQALAAGQPVFVDYTAAWCVTCQFNKQTVLNQAAFMQLAQSQRVVLLRADWTRHDAAIGASLRSLGRAAVPTYVVYLPARPDSPEILNEILHLDAIREALSRNGA